MIDFYKYQGAGNDFILIDNRLSVFTGNKVDFAQKWCNRRFGIGSDGVIFIEDTDKADFEMDFYNPDGSQSFCGNGSRCAVAFAHFLGIVANEVVFLAIDGLHEAKRLSETIQIAMHQNGPIRQMGADYFVHTGSPHYISYHTATNPKNIIEFGRSIRYSDVFKAEGTNVNLIEELAPNHIAIRTYERGVEDETLACGTGATACGLCFAEVKGLTDGFVHVSALGGELKIHFEKSNLSGFYEHIWLEGPAEFVFKGKIE